MAEACVLRTKSVVEALLFHHLKNRFRARSIAEAGKFLDLPPDLTDIKDQMHALRTARTYRSLRKPGLTDQ